MNRPLCSNTQFVRCVEELVRGQEQEFVQRLQPLVRRQNVTLDLEEIKRIDAAGLTALITLYCEACQSGCRFAIANPAPHVRQILALVGLEAILVAGNTEEFCCFRPQFQETAA